MRVCKRTGRDPAQHRRAGFTVDYGVEEHEFCTLTTCTLNLTTRTLYDHNMHTASDSMHTAERNMSSAD